MAKTKLSKIHKIVIHPNRWLIWTIAYAVIVTVALVGYIKVTDVSFEAQVAENTFYPWHNYKDSRLGFDVRYPADWSIEADSNSAITFVPSTNSDEGVTVEVTSPDSEKAIRKTLKISSEVSTQLDDMPAQKIANDLGMGHSETVILALHGNKLYVIRGTDAFVRQLQLTFHFE
ncbi:MAG: PsbP-related protein [Candidatus Doudnabacteria bacterium]